MIDLPGVHKLTYSPFNTVFYPPLSLGESLGSAQDSRYMGQEKCMGSTI
jgi:hypothetical protein